MLFSIRTPLLAGLFVLIWSSGWIGSQYSLNYASAIGFLAWRYIFVVITLLVLVTLFRQWCSLSWRELQLHASVGLLSHTAFLAFGNAAIEAGVSSGMVAFITAMQPILTLAVAYPILNERINKHQALGIVVGVFSVALVIGEKLSLGGEALIYALPVFSVLALTLASIMSRHNDLRKIKRSRSATPLLMVLLVQCSAAAIGFNSLAWFLDDFALKVDSGLFYLMAYMVLVISIGSFGLYFLLLRRMSTVKVASLVYLTPPATMVLGWVVFRDVLSWTDLIGLALALVAVVLVTRKEPVAAKPGGDRATEDARVTNSELLSLKMRSGLSIPEHETLAATSLSSLHVVNSSALSHRPCSRHPALKRCQKKAYYYRAMQGRDQVNRFTLAAAMKSRLPV